MDTLESYRQIIRKILTYYANIPYAYGEIECKMIYDPEADSFLLMTIGWNGDRRVHGCLVHVDIINDKIWIQRDGIEYGMANELIDAGVPKEKIVLAFRHAKVRPYTDFAVA
jgi:hypothetical protein